MTLKREIIAWIEQLMPTAAEKMPPGWQDSTAMRHAGNESRAVFSDSYDANKAVYKNCVFVKKQFNNLTIKIPACKPALCEYLKRVKKAGQI